MTVGEPIAATEIAGLLQHTKVYDVDTHITEPRDLWTSRLPASKWGDNVPHTRLDDTGREYWWVGAKKCSPAVGGASNAGWSKGLYPKSTPTTYEEAHPGVTDPLARLTWMDEHGVFAQVLYPNLIGFQVKPFLALDEDLRLACIKAYNDFQTEFCSVAPDRLIPLTNLPWWDVAESVTELERCREMGHKGVNFGWRLEHLGFEPLRSEHWEPILKTAEEADLPVNFHVAFNSEGVDSADIVGKPTLDHLKFSAQFFTGNIGCVTELIMGGLCDRYPNLKFVSVESGVGWIPYLLDVLDWEFTVTSARHEHPDMLLPSEYFRRQIYGTFWFERDIAQLAELYPDNFMFESDFPHSTCLAPQPGSAALDPRDTILTNLPSLPGDLVTKLVCRNAQKVYGLA